MSANPVRVFLATAGQEELNVLYAAFLQDARLQVASLATSFDMLEANLRSVRAEVLVIDAELLAGRGEKGMVEYLNRVPAAAIVLLPPPLVHLQGVLRQAGQVREVAIKPVNYAALVQRAYEVGINERAAQQVVSPGLDIYRPTAPTGAAVVGTRVFAFYATKGGTGKTTTAVNFAYRLMQAGIRTLLMGFDVPDDIGVFLNLSRTPNAANFFHRPGHEGFKASIQRKDTLEVILSPNDPVFAEEVAARPPLSEGSIVQLIETARGQNPPYGGIVMDLPPTESEWSIQPLLRANTVIMVLQPSLADVNKLISTITLMTGVMDPRHALPREAIYVVINGVTPDDNLTAKAIQEMVQEKAGFCPPIIATIPWHSQVRPLQNNAILPVTRIDDYCRAIDRMVDFFYRNVLGAPPTRAARRLLPINIKFV